MTLNLPSDKKAVEAAFAKLAEAYPLDYLPNMDEAISGAMERLNEFADDFVGPNLKVAGMLEDRSRMLLREYAKLNTEQRALAVGAIRYFIVNMDGGDPDTTPITGFDDDVLVMNAVLERLGFGEQRIDTTE